MGCTARASTRIKTQKIYRVNILSNFAGEMSGRWDARPGQEHVLKHRFFTVQINCNRVNNMCHVQGEWLADRMHGKGKYTYSTGKVYDGMWAEDRPVLFFSFFIFFPPIFLTYFTCVARARCMTACGLTLTAYFVLYCFFFCFFSCLFSCVQHG